MDAIARSRDNDLWRLINALGIRQVGEKAAKTLAQRFGTMDALAAAPEEELTAVDDVGPITARYLCQWMKSPQSRDLLARLKAVGVNMTCKEKTVDSRFAGMTFVLTGTLEKFTRDAAAEMIEERGGKAAGSVSKRPPMWWPEKMPAASCKSRGAGHSRADGGRILALLD